MTSGSRQIRVACEICGYDRIRTLKAGDDRTLDQLRASVRCGRCRAWAAKGSVTVEWPGLDPRHPGLSIVGRPGGDAATPRNEGECTLQLGRDPDRLFIDSTRKGRSGELIVTGKSFLTSVAIAHPAGPAPFHVSNAAGLQKARALNGRDAFNAVVAGAFLTIMGILSLPIGIFDKVIEYELDRRPRGLPTASQCDGWLADMEDGSRLHHATRQEAFDWLAATCPSTRSWISELRFLPNYR